MPKHWHAPRWWLAQAVCIHEHEGAWNDPWAPYEGGMQFLASTYATVGGRVRDRAGRLLRYDRRSHTFNGVPYHWASLDSPREQLYRAWLLWKHDRGSWHEWGTAGVCGLR